VLRLFWALCWRTLSSGVGGDWSWHGGSSWEEKMGTGSGAEVKEGQAGYAPEREAGEKHPEERVRHADILLQPL
jgi:hypothetical protein